MKKNIFQPFEGTSEVPFRSSRSEVRKLLGNDFTTILRNEFAPNTSDYYEGLGLFVEYDTEDNCDALEIANEGTLFLNGENLIKIGYSQLREKFDAQSKNLEEEDEIGITYFDLGFGVSKVFDSNDVEAIIIFGEKYWED